MNLRNTCVAMIWTGLVVVGLGAASVQEGFLQGLSPEAIDDMIASTRRDVPATLTIANRDITVLRAAVLDRSSAERAAAARTIIETMTADGARLTASSRPVSNSAVISVGSRDVFALVPLDVDGLLGESVASKAAAATARLQLALDEISDARRPQIILWGAAQAAVVTLAFGAAVWGLWRMNRWAVNKASQTTAHQLSRLAVGHEIVRETRLVQYVRRLISLSLFAVALALGYLWLTFVLRRFPYTRPWGESLRAFLIDRVSSFGQAVLVAIPDLFTIILILLLTRFAIRVINLVFLAVEENRMRVGWIYPETAQTTKKLVTGLLWLFALVMAYPYLPGSDTDAFKGVSVFVGLMVSLGSSGLVNQVMSGFTLTYSRALRQGDYVRIGDVEGTVTQLGTLSTKIETPRHEEVTIPNAVLVSNGVTNYSRHAAAGVFVPTEVTIGYDAPWRKVEAMLLSAAAATPGVRSDPAPAVRQTALEDFYVRYTLLVSLDDPARRVPILNRLHANIQDAFNENGVQIMSPNYEADPGEPKVVPKERWFA